MEPTVKTRKLDDRRSKRYGRLVTVYCDPGTRIGGNGALATAIRSRMEADAAKPLGERRFDGGHYYDCQVGSYFFGASATGGTDVSVTFLIPAAKPSLICSEGEGIAWGDDVAADLVVPVVRELAAERLLFEARERIAEDATKVARWLASVAVEEAQKVTRYEQRMAALKAELDAEIKAQLKELHKGGDQHESVTKAIAEWRNERGVEDPKGPVSDEAVRFGFAHAKRYAQVPHWSRGHGTNLTVSDLFPTPNEES